MKLCELSNHNKTNSSCSALKPLKVFRIKPQKTELLLSGVDTKQKNT